MNHLLFYTFSCIGYSEVALKDLTCWKNLKKRISIISIQSKRLRQAIKRNGFLALAIMLELAYFVLSLMAIEPLIRAAFAFPSLFIIPGLVLSVALSSRDETDLASLVVKGFFISAILLVLTTSLMLLVHVALTSVTSDDSVNLSSRIELHAVIANFEYPSIGKHLAEPQVVPGCAE
jgi:hypothetical protein